MNSVNLIGRITKDIELKTTESGMVATSMFIAINNGKNENGEERMADFPKICVYEKQAENLAKYCKKGSLVGVNGRIKTRNYEKEDGTKIYETYVIANRVEFLDTKSSSSGYTIPEADYPVHTETPSYTPVEEKQEEPVSDPFAEFGEQVSLSDDDLPF